MVYKAGATDAAQRPARASGRVTFLQHCILYATRYQSRAAAHNLREHNAGVPATICRIDLLLASCIQLPVTCIGYLVTIDLTMLVG